MSLFASFLYDVSDDVCHICSTDSVVSGCQFMHLLLVAQCVNVVTITPLLQQHLRNLKMTTSCSVCKQYAENFLHVTQRSWHLSLNWYGPSKLRKQFLFCFDAQTMDGVCQLENCMCIKQ